MADAQKTMLDEVNQAAQTVKDRHGITDREGKVRVPMALLSAELVVQRLREEGATG